jgi:hypothetical protein
MGYRRCGHRRVGEECALRRTEAQRPRPRLIVDAEQEVDLLQLPNGACFPPRDNRFASFHQQPTPAVRRRVHEHTERRHVSRWMLLALPQTQARVEHEAMCAAQPGEVVGE